jgi:ribosome-binding ATPase YchF (GTP1/OBG family)
MTINVEHHSTQEELDTERVMIKQMRIASWKHTTHTDQERKRKREQNARYRAKQKEVQDRLVAAYGGIPVFDPITKEFLGVREKWGRAADVINPDKSLESLTQSELISLQIENLQKEMDKLQLQLEASLSTGNEEEGEISEEDWKAYCLENDLDEQGRPKT